jgi:dTDP-4-amino-4,6-dideoxygalactose transaminase
MHEVVTHVPFLDLTLQFRSLEEEWLAAIRETGNTGSFILGPNVQAFERELAAYAGVKHAVACANGTDALVLSLRALGIGPGDEVITTAFTFFATAEAVTQVGAKPVFVDIEPDSFNIDPRAIGARLTDRTRAVIPVHLYGNPAKMEEILALARARGLAVIEDCAQAFGATVGGRRVGAMGDTGCFSFYPTKVLGCYGDGGMITTDRDDVAEHLRRLRNHGAYRPFLHNEIGYNSRLDEIQAALLRIKLRSIDQAMAGRAKVAGEYAKRLQLLAIGLPAPPKHGRHVFNLYTVRLENRDRIRQVLADNGVATSVCYPQPLHRQEVYSALDYRAGSLPVSEQAAREVLSLPIYPGMPLVHIERVVEVLDQALRRG